MVEDEEKIREKGAANRGNKNHGSRPYPNRWSSVDHPNRRCVAVQGGCEEKTMAMVLFLSSAVS